MTNPEDDPPGSAYEFLFKLTKPPAPRSGMVLEDDEDTWRYCGACESWQRGPCPPLAPLTEGDDE